ncbi:hypothetical protein ABJI51_15460 [Amycolatopsis sp. NEAU-NG30]|uniref:Uncharacterized protein n=1 Tax=Amycolatopsis melonis TaxID=3156488 RepID=A0ABV0LDX8_9PSEU
MEPTRSADREFCWWEMMCDRNHAWWRPLANMVEPSVGDLTCPVDGEQAVTAGRRKLADRVELSLIPAAWDDGGVVGFEDQYFVRIADHSSGRFLRSAEDGLAGCRAPMGQGGARKD